jgi:hypothetical protein
MSRSKYILSYFLIGFLRNLTLLPLSHNLFRENMVLNSQFLGIRLDHL